MIYLDNAATTYPKPECVYLALDKANRNAFNTGRGSYKVAREASNVKENVRKKIMQLNNIKNANVVYTNSATTALNDIIFGIELNRGDYVYVTPLEPNSIIRPLEELKKRKEIKVEIIPFDKKNWKIDIEKTSDMFALHKPSAIFVSQISNVTGYELPYNMIFEMGKKYDSINILDASQGYGIVKINNYIDINYIVFAGHKSLYASFGIAGYIKLKSDKIKSNIFGGTGTDTMNPNMPENIPDGYEAGSPNIVAISSLNASIDWLNEVNIYEHEKELTDYLIQRLKLNNKIKVYIPNEIKNIFGVVSFSIKGYDSEDVGKILDEEYNICVRTGFHCAPLIHDFIGSIENKGTVRIGLSYFNTKEDIDTLIEALKTF